MNKKIELNIKIPSINDYWKPRVINNRFNGMYLAPKGKHFKEALRLTALQFYKKPTSAKLHMNITLFLSNMNRDVDNVLKPILDALEGVVYNNDRQIYILTISKNKQEQIFLQNEKLDTLIIEIKEIKEV